MSAPKFAIHDASGLEPGALRLQFDCVHGRTSAVLLPGRGPHGYTVAGEVLIVRHERFHGCACSRSVGLPAQSPALA